MPRSEDEREALDELVRLPGWRLFCEHVMQEWRGPGYMQRMGKALESNDTIAPHVVHRTATEVVKLLAWPQEQLRTPKGKP